MGLLYERAGRLTAQNGGFRFGSDEERDLAAARGVAGVRADGRRPAGGAEDEAGAGQGAAARRRARQPLQGRPAGGSAGVLRSLLPVRLLLREHLGLLRPPPRPPLLLPPQLQVLQLLLLHQLRPLRTVQRK